MRVDVLAVGDIRDCAPYCDHSSCCLIRRYSGLIVHQIWFVLSNKIEYFFANFFRSVILRDIIMADWSVSLHSPVYIHIYKSGVRLSSLVVFVG